MVYDYEINVEKNPLPQEIYRCEQLEQEMMNPSNLKYWPR